MSQQASEATAKTGCAQMDMAPLTPMARPVWMGAGAAQPMRTPHMKGIPLVLIAS